MSRTTWILESAGEHRVNLLRNGRRVRGDLSPAEAQRYLREHASPSDRVLREEDDGYRVTVRR